MTPWGQTLWSFSSSIITPGVSQPYAVLDVVVDDEVYKIGIRPQFSRLSLKGQKVPPMD